MADKTPAADQAKRFAEMAREVEADETGAAFERQFGKIVPPKRRPPIDKKTKKGRAK